MYNEYARRFLRDILVFGRAILVRFTATLPVTTSLGNVHPFAFPEQDAMMSHD